MSTLQCLLNRFDGAMLVRPVAAGLVINMAKPSVYNRVSAGTFPLPLVKTSTGHMVRVSDIADYIDALEPIKPIAKPLHGGVGRPTKAEQVEAQRRGISVPEMRAQRSLGGI